MNRFLREPISVRNAASVIVTATFIVVVGGGIAIRAIDHREYSSIWEGMWWSLQTVTTVGYGDVTPKDAAGRIVGAVVMLEGIAFLAIVTAAITSTFVTRAQREQKSGPAGRGDRRGGTRRPSARTDRSATRASRVAAAGAHETVSRIAIGTQSAWHRRDRRLRARPRGHTHPPPKRVIPNARLPRHWSAWPGWRRPFELHREALNGQRRLRHECSSRRSKLAAVSGTQRPREGWNAAGGRHLAG